ncbi:hypothetical protein EVAR_82528_1 [Eumeta japonica]|uniref:Uncharacterized protein n=1 Tax=Eumeta variegata TaxID=151549 RepID=A0A4C1UXP6_EUMVA|nr:hypothetical protein EVAR_82528_1 [Eumeta japonica]
MYLRFVPHSVHSSGAHARGGRAPWPTVTHRYPGHSLMGFGARRPQGRPFAFKRVSNETKDGRRPPRRSGTAVHRSHHAQYSHTYIPTCRRVVGVNNTNL